MNFQFEIESIFKPTTKETVYLFAKALATSSFQLTDNSKLEGIRIENWCDIPRAHDKEGNLRTYLFVFALKKCDEKDKLSIGQIVELMS